MRVFSIITALIVAATLYAFVMERDRLMALAGDAPSDVQANGRGDTQVSEGPDTRVRVMVLQSLAQDVDSAVLLRGETEALRQIEVRSETSGKVISEPLRKGALVEQGQLLCEIDPGTRRVTLAEAEARLAEARANVPTSQARILEAQAAIPAAEANLKQAQARVPEAEAGLATARAKLPEAEARLVEAEARVKEAEINLNAAKKLAESGYAAQTRLANAEAAFEAAKAGVKTALSGLKAAESGIEGAKSQIQNATAGVESARSQVESARAALQSARSGEESAQSGIQAAEAGVASANKEIERVSIHAPFGGLLETDTAELGALMQPGSACGTVIQLQPIKLVGFAPETQVARIETGAMAGARLVDGREVVGQVTFVSRSADPVTRTFRVELEVDNSDLSIRDGQTAEIAIQAEGVKAHLLPQSSLTLDNEGRLGVRIVDEGSKALFQEITLLRDTRDGIWVTGLGAKADVIILGQEYVTDGVAVAPHFEEVTQ
ncbi:MAG: efflux RND transporter periplasmic adaptor subunit [Pelagimonas sp.]|jgi:multidrug efflux system membrane fusion protein|nr:efflux RND transporter periplasmic adaptor subunit [Pelagimonas sp.]